MATVASEISIESADGGVTPNGRISAQADLIGRQWPSLSRAIGSYQQNTAETFTRMAYEKVEAGLIRLDDRRDLAQTAQEMGIRDFDAQLLIACAIRKWSLDRRYDPTPSREAPELSFEHRSWGRVWLRIALLLGGAVALDGLLLWRWLS